MSCWLRFTSIVHLESIPGAASATIGVESYLHCIASSLEWLGASEVAERTVCYGTIAVQNNDRVLGARGHASGNSERVFEFYLYFAASWTHYVPSALHVEGVGSAGPAHCLDGVFKSSEQTKTSTTACW